MVQLSKVIELQRRWREAGSPPCDHPEIDREYDLGSNTGDYACLQCGESLPPEQWQAMR